MPIVESIACLSAITLSLFVAAVAYTRLLDQCRRLRSAPVRNGIAFIVYLAFSACIVAALIAIIRLDMFGLDSGGEAVRVVAEMMLFAIAAGPALFFVRRSAGIG